MIAAFASWHEKHRPADEALDTSVRLVAHAALEAYSVLTRLPSPHRVSGAVVREFLFRRFPDALLALTSDAVRDLLQKAPEKGISGGAIYDALIGASAAEAGAVLITCDQRAAATYERLGVAVRIL